MKKITRLLLAFAMIINFTTTFVAPVTAADTISGNWTYSLNGSNAIIKGTNLLSAAITIPSTIDGYTITDIGSGAFKNNSILKSIFIPESVKSIGTFAFEGCSKLEDIKLPNQLTTIDAGAFRNCSALTSIWIPNTLTSVGLSYNIIGTGSGNAPIFSGTNIETAIIENGMINLPNYLFWNCENLKSVVLPDSITSIGTFAFRYCSKLENISLPKQLTSINAGAFQGCTSLTSIWIPNTLTSVGFNYSITGIGVGSAPIFSGTKITTTTLENGTMSILPNMFRDCTSLTTIIIPDTITIIGANAFTNCPNLTIYCFRNSYAASYAITNNIIYKYINYITISNYEVLKNANGFSITASFDNISTAKNGIANIAIYNIEGKLLHYSYEPISIKSGIDPDYTKTVTYTPVAGQEYVIKLFVWENHQTLTPISDFATKTVR